MSRALLSSLGEQYRQRLEEIRSRFFLARDPGQTLESLSQATDELVRGIADNHAQGGDFSILALGGYGRRELYPCSDLDLLFLHEEGSAVEGKIKRVLHDLWDLGLKLGQQVWTPGELERSGFCGLELVLALLDARWLWGEGGRGREVLEETFPRYLEGERHALMEAITRLTRERHQAYQNTLYHLEPDLKEGPGGLRDHLAGRWMLRLQSRGQLFFHFTWEEVEESCRFLRRSRLLLHYLGRRNQNRLTHRMQEEVARHLGYGGDSRRAVESLMREHFLNARRVYRFCCWAQRLGRPREEEGLSDLEAGDPTPSLRAALELFLRAFEEGRPLSDRARQRLARALPRLRREGREADLEPYLRRLFQPRAGLYRSLGDLYELGYLELLFPEFTAIKARMIRDFYHRYTVDEHTLMAMRALEELLEGEEDARFRTLLEEVERPERLTLALLLHDVGKSGEGKHSVESARLAAQALARFRFPGPEIDVIVFLVRHHLVMSSTLFRRDLDDPRVIERFADRVGDTDRLRLLCLLTYADIWAVGPGILNPWKKDLLWQLYVSTYQHLTVGFGRERLEAEQLEERLLGGLPEDLGREGFQCFLEGFPRRYLKATPAREVYEHYRLASRLGSESAVELRLSDQGTHYELCVLTPDRRHLFAKIVGVLAYFEMNVLRGFGFSNRAGTVLDLFQFQDLRRVLGRYPEEGKRLERTLRAVIGEEMSVEELLAGKENSPLFQSPSPGFEPAVFFARQEEGQYSILEIVAPDSLGLLYRIGREMARLECNIELLLISTEGDKAVDVFYLSREGAQLAPHLRRELGERVRRAIGAAP